VVDASLAARVAALTWRPASLSKRGRQRQSEFRNATKSAFSVLPIELDEVTTWKRMQPSLAQIMRARAAVPFGYADMAAAYPDLFVSRGAAKMALTRENREQMPTEKYLKEFVPVFRQSAIAVKAREGRPGNSYMTRPGSTRPHGSRNALAPWWCCERTERAVAFGRGVIEYSGAHRQRLAREFSPEAVGQHARTSCLQDVTQEGE
jgi:hypothetical protein